MTKIPVSIFYQSIKEAREIENIPANDLLLLKFFCDLQSLAKCQRVRRTEENFFTEKLSVLAWPYHIINILLTELSRSVWKNLDLGHVEYRPCCIRSVRVSRPRSKFSQTDLLLG